MLRTLAPRITKRGAIDLDESTVLKMLSYTQIDQSPELTDPSTKNDTIKRVKSRTFLAKKYGGLGIISAEETRHSAYAGSWALCASHLKLIDSSLAFNMDNQTEIPNHLKDINETIIHINTNYNNVISDITLSSIWLEPTHRLQKKIKIKIDEAHRLRDQLLWPYQTVGITGNPNEFTNIHDREKVLGAMATSCPFANSVLAASPKYFHNRIHNNQMCIIFRMVWMLDWLPRGRLCNNYIHGHICGKEIGTYGTHYFQCQSRCRYKQHQIIAGALRREIKNIRKDIEIDNAEPFAANFFNAIPGRRNNVMEEDETEVKRRLDILITYAGSEDLRFIEPFKKAPRLAIDVTTITPLSQQTINNYSYPGEAANFSEERKRKHYRKKFRYQRHS
jgi:hypothetical protein